METLFYHDLFWINVKDPYLRGQNQCVVVRDIVSGRTKPVPVKDSAHAVPVGKQYRCRTVPRLHHGGVILIEILLLLGHSLCTCPWLRNGNHHSQRQIHSTHDHELNGIVKHGRIRA